MPNKYRAPTVTKAFEMLKAISRAKRGLGISELAKKLKISKGTVYGVTLALEEMGAVVRDPLTKKFSIGYAIVEMGTRGLAQMPLREAAGGPMRRLAEETEESVFLGVLQGEHVLIVDMVESSKDLKITSPTGTKLPLSAGATGKLFLAHMTRSDALKYLKTRGLKEYTKNSITDLERYTKQLDEVLKLGYAIDSEEYLQGVRAVAARIKTQNHPQVAIWTVGFSSSITDEKLEHIIEQTLKAADAISDSLHL